MGLFSLFGKKDGKQAKPSDKDASRAKRQPAAPAEGRPSGGSRTSVKRDTQAAMATALKIDAIESEMSSEFVQFSNTQPAAPAQRPAGKPPDAVPAPRAEAAQQGKPALQPMTTENGTTTDFLLDGQSAIVNMAVPASQAAAVIEEAAIMYANGQSTLVEQMLKSAVEEDLLGDATRNAWWMLFDLYQITGKREAFDNLSIAYASRFETSPPAWTESGRARAAAAGPQAGAAPLVPFSGTLDASCGKQIERALKLSETYRTLRLEFARVKAVDAGGCRLLLGLLRKLQKSEHGLVLVGAPELADRIRAIIEVGRRDDTEEPWLLLMEILRLLNREKEFEETSIDYCVTFEVSPPAFSAPQGKVTTAAVEPQAVTAPAEGLSMPAVVEGRIDNLILAIATYSDEHSPAVIDCSRLVRVDFGAAGRLLTGLAPFCGAGRAIEFHDVNHLVAELFNVIGLKDIARVVTRKY